MNTLRISLFGGVRIQQSGDAAPLKLTRIIQALLAYLLLQRPRSQPREILAELFWGDQPPERAHSCLNTALWRLRQVLEPEGTARGTYLVTTTSGDVAFNWESAYWLDVAVFDDAARHLFAKAVPELTPEDVDALTRALQLCTGELLEGFYDDWVIREREYLRQRRLDTLARLLAYHKLHQDYDLGIACGQQILAIEPLSEEYHRELMYLYAETGQRSQALRQYEICRALLAKELEIAPMPETQALFAQIKSASGEPLAAVDAGERANVQQVVQQLQEALRAFDEARRLLQRAIRTFEHLG
jgi:DNA-binding SARP family transcriptional activator